MGHQNIQATSHMINLDRALQNHCHSHPDPCIFYGTAMNLPQSNIYSVIPAPGNLCNINFLPMPERMLYGIQPYNGVHPQLPASNLDIAVAASRGHYNPHMPLPPDGYFQHADGIQLFKRESSEEASLNFQSASAGPSSSAFPMAVRPVEAHMSQVDGASVPPTGYGRESNLACGANHLVQRNNVVRPVQLSGNPWSGMHFCAANGDIGMLAWPQPPNSPALHGVPVYHATAINLNAAGFLHGLVGHEHSNPHSHVRATQGIRAYNVNISPQLTTCSCRLPQINFPNAGINPFSKAGDTRPPFLAPALSTPFWLYQPHHREILIDPGARQSNFPHLRVLHEDEVAVLEIPRYHEAGDSIDDQHRDLRLDIDHMSYEELLALGDHIGSVGTGLTVDFIRNTLKVRTYTPAPSRMNVERAAFPHQQIKSFCAVCQNDYGCEENIGMLSCGHEYHEECIKKWLLVKNACPVCKSTALAMNT